MKFPENVFQLILEKQGIQTKSMQNRGVTVTQDERGNLEKHKQVERIVKFDHKTVAFQLKEQAME